MTEVGCILCDKSDYKVLYPATDSPVPKGAGSYACTNTGHGRCGRIVKCNGCGLVYVNPRRSDSEILGDYRDVVDEKYLDEKKYRELTFVKNLDIIRRYKKEGRILDVGCYTGAFLEAARKAGWEASGVEPSKWACDYARGKLGLDVLNGTIGDYAGDGLDAITLWDTIEHMADPLGELRRAAPLLKDDGYLFISTMDVDSLFRRLMGRRWPWFMEMHLYYFNPYTIRRLLEKAGFETVYTGPYTHIVSLGYLAYKASSFSGGLSKFLGRALDRLKFGRIPVGVCLGDIMLVVAKKKNG